MSAPDYRRTLSMVRELAKARAYADAPPERLLEAIERAIDGSHDEFVWDDELVAGEIDEILRSGGRA